MSDLQVHLDRLAPLPADGHEDWDDVVRRARGPVRRRWALGGLVAAAVLIGLLVATPAFGLRADLFGEAPTPTWTWPKGVPGDPVTAPKIVKTINDDLHGKFLRNRVEIDTTRLVTTAGSGNERLSLLAAGGVGGGVCIAEISGELATPQMTSGFSCPDAERLSGRAVTVEETSGGHRGSVVDYTTLVGITRADVGRVELELVNGETIELPLNRWRGFGYHATDPQRFPKTLSVYATWNSLFQAHKKLVGQLPLQKVGELAPTPLCGGSAGPCPEGVKP